jgi:hypothetical protein
VDEGTIINWERNRTAPAGRFMAAVLRFLRCHPLRCESSSTALRL